MKQQFYLPVSTRFFFVNNYDTCKMMGRLDERVCTVAKEARGKDWGGYYGKTHCIVQ